jgi:hypothetical protein
LAALGAGVLACEVTDGIIAQSGVI